MSAMMSQPERAFSTSGRSHRGSVGGVVAHLERVKNGQGVVQGPLCRVGRAVGVEERLPRRRPQGMDHVADVAPGEANSEEVVAESP